MTVKQRKLFETYYYETRKSIYLYLLRKVNNKELAEDLVAEVFLKLSENVVILEERDLNGIRAWLYTVARNKTIDHFRKKGRSKQAVALEDEIFEIVSAEEGNYLKNEMLKDDSKMLMGALNLLSTYEKEIVLLRFKEEMQFNEISEVVGKSEGAVKMSLYRALEKLKENLDGRVNLDLESE